MRTEDAVPITPGQTEAKVSVLLMASIHVVLLVAGAEIPWNTVKHISTETFVEVTSINNKYYLFDVVYIEHGQSSYVQCYFKCEYKTAAKSRGGGGAHFAVLLS